ncbi:TIGR04283 family arsenosugar biosynthesis glycosyltransferase [Costertonia aggregata]|uniref:TIGR04283 family arsenosugar biosynthesis glycosyltransferase n=2 Tax=Costertonia aggregata TaxID=343403 RepID=A0A7H9AUZ0_9FLAO|nr:TIGR04283 family arsenosugar biosynthesis glycosyltransferase [Costertonia aggregata]
MGKIIDILKERSSPKNIQEIIVVDGGSTDNTVNVALEAGASVIHSPVGRAKQLNMGAKYAQGNILYFLHADTSPPYRFDENILNAIKKDNTVGCFQMKFDSDSRFLNFFAWFTRINHILCRGGDQSLFITKNLFEKSGGFNEDYKVYEDNEYISRLYKLSSFTILPRHVKTSARRYEEKGEIKLQYHFGVIHLKNYLGAGPEQLYDYYKRKIAL